MAQIDNDEGHLGRRGANETLVDNREAKNHFNTVTYEYACTACGHAWEAEQSISAAPLTECPSCKQATAKRQVSGGAGFILKGGGWYADLYSSAKKSPEGASESSSSETKKSADKPKTDAAAAAPSTSSTTSPGSSSSGGGSSSSGGSSSTGTASS